ncbi:MAG TPA: hypothetical protein DDZ41_09120 [Flavobacterium sp.]|nr:hypothetical protein [Flavobacterium sp.]
MKIDLLVTTYKRVKDLLVLLKNLEFQEYKNFRLQIFDGTPDESVKKAVEAYSNHTNRVFCYEIIYHKTSCGMTKQRNIAVDNTAGDISIFLDDDVELEKNYLTEVVQVFLNDPESTIAGLNGFDTFNLQHKSKNLGRRKKIYRLLGLYPNVGAARYLPWGHNTAHFNILKSGVEDVDVLIGHNMAFRTHILKKFRFSTFFEQYETYVLYDDQDICLRLKKAGYRLVIAYNAQLKHTISPVGRPLAKHYGYQAFFNAHRNWKLFGSQKLVHKFKFWCWEFLDIIFQLPSKSTREMALGRLKIFLITLFKI